MNWARAAISTLLAVSLAACGGGGTPAGGGATGGGGGGGGAGGTCSLASREQWAFSVLDEWYLFPDLMDPNVNGGNFNDLQSYIDAVVAPARAQSKDRYFT